MKRHPAVADPMLFVTNVAYMRKVVARAISLGDTSERPSRLMQKRRVARVALGDGDGGFIQRTNSSTLNGRISRKLLRTGKNETGLPR